jgi:hypothetical protein
MPVEAEIVRVDENVIAPLGRGNETVPANVVEPENRTDAHCNPPLQLGVADLAPPPHPAFRNTIPYGPGPWHAFWPQMAVGDQRRSSRSCTLDLAEVQREGLSPAFCRGAVGHEAGEAVQMPVGVVPDLFEAGRAAMSVRTDQPVVLCWRAVDSHQLR